MADQNLDLAEALVRMNRGDYSQSHLPLFSVWTEHLSQEQVTKLLKSANVLCETLSPKEFETTINFLLAHNPQWITEEQTKKENLAMIKAIINHYKELSPKKKHQFYASISAASLISAGLIFGAINVASGGALLALIPIAVGVIIAALLIKKAIAIHKNKDVDTTKSSALQNIKEEAINQDKKDLSDASNEPRQKHSFFFPSPQHKYFVMDRATRTEFGADAFATMS